MNATMLPLLLTLVAATVSAQTPINQTRAVNADARIEVANIKGSVTVTGWDRAEVAIGGTLGSGSKALSIEGDASHLQIKVEAPERGWLDWGADTRMGDTVLELKVPRGAALAIDTVSADVELDGVAGNALKVHTVSGKSRLDSGAARVDIDSVSGDVDLTAKAARADLETVSGNIRARGLGGEIELQTVSGNIDADTAAYRKLDAQTVSGDIRLRGTPADDAVVAVESMSGDVHLGLPATVSARLRASTFSGRIRSDFGDGAASRDKRLEVTLGSGSGQIRLETFSGDIEIRKP
ncbi:MAG: DUF4097 family beta strand repeat protein [Dokdonella sp.]|uniref:DUF4097 family beta strand repeat-containing protein n=1 Tax=Dokdonella sp. TaxID=2291710 RepID=UPI0027B95CBA|nr:DUF4097 family beta strand repeat-containing protein [Dokdonella sp.]MCW5578894.1 DUF4097 family beta strand repeat protein [Dokdonella sp.]